MLSYTLLLPSWKFTPNKHLSFWKVLWCIFSKNSVPVVKKTGYQTGYPVDYQVTGHAEYPVSGFQICRIFGKFGIWCMYPYYFSKPSSSPKSGTWKLGCIIRKGQFAPSKTRIYFLPKLDNDWYKQLKFVADFKDVNCLRGKMHHKTRHSYYL